MTTVTEPFAVTPIAIRELRTESRVYESRFDLDTHYETQAPDGRKLRIVGIEIKERGRDAGTAHLGRLFVNWGLKDGSYSRIDHLYGGPLDADTTVVVDAAVASSISSLEALTPDGMVAIAGVVSTAPMYTQTLPHHVPHVSFHMNTADGPGYNVHADGELAERARLDLHRRASIVVVPRRIYRLSTRQITPDLDAASFDVEVR